MKIPSLVFAAVILSHSLFADDWPQWRGVNRDAKSAETGLLKSWPEAGPKVVWRTADAGVGYSSVSVSNGKIYTMGDLDGVEHILCFDEQTGKRLWAVQPGPVKAKLDASVDEQFAKLDLNQDKVVDEFEILEKGNYQTVKFDSADESADVSATAESRCDGFIKHYDKDVDGSLNVAEIPAGLGRDIRNIDRPSGGRREMNSIAIKRATETIAILDANQDGSLDRKEYQKTILRTNANKIDLAENGAKKGDGVLTEEELKTYFSKGERSLDGVISREELLNYFTANYPGCDGKLTPEDIKGSMGGYRNGQGDGPRGTPTVVGNRIFTEGGNGDVTCLDAETGNTIWHTNLVDDHGGKRPGWGYSESPLLVGSQVFVTPGAKDSGTLVALNSESGSMEWQTADVKQGAHYASPILATIGGKQQIVQFGKDSMFGVALEDGSHLWSYSNAANGTANCSTAIVEGDKVLASSAYGTGGGVAAISNAGDTQSSEQVWFEKKLANHHGGLVKVDDHVYGFGVGGLICIHFDSGEIKWSEPSVKKGSLIYADGMLYCLGEKHEVALVEANPGAYVEKGRFAIESQGRWSWAHPVIANGILYLRDQQTLTAYDIRS